MRWLKRLCGRRNVRFVADRMVKGEPVPLGDIVGLTFDRRKGGVWIDVLDKDAILWHWWLRLESIGQIRIRCAAGGGWLYCEVE